MADEGIARISYRPPASHALDIEFLSMRELRTRATADVLRQTHRLEFHLIILVTQGECTHVVDLQPIPCKPGSLLVLQPSQTEQFDVTSDWDGWVVPFRPEFLFARLMATENADVNLVAMLGGLPGHLALDEPGIRLVTGMLTQMQEDSKIHVSAAEIHALIRHQLCTLLIRLSIAHRLQKTGRLASPSDLQPVRRFQQLVEQRFAQWHQVGRYASAMGCTEKTLTRATMAMAGVTAKAFIAARICLEAKRLLSHTSMSVEKIGDQLGFYDASYFVKFFKREVGCTPLEFRRKHEVDRGVRAATAR